MSSKEVANEIITNIYERDKCDMLVEPILVTVVLGSYLVFTISYAISQAGRLQSLADDGLLAMHVATFLTLGILVVMSVFFLLMSRNEKHSQREDDLRDSMIRYLEEINHLQGKNLDSYIAEMKKIDKKILSKERPAPARKWGMIIVAPLILMVLSSFSETNPMAVPVLALALLTSLLALILTIRGVTNFSYNHEKRWIEFLVPFEKALRVLNIKSSNNFNKQVGFRSFILFLALSVLTGWLFLPIWAYLLFKDMNKHFVEQWVWENSLIRGLRNFEIERTGLKMERVQDYSL